MAKNAFDAKRTNLYMFNPNELHLVTDEKDPLYDPRMKLPVDEALVLNILYQGVLEPVVIVKRDGKPTVVDGRQRVRAAREAHKRSQKTGGPEIRVPAVQRHDTELGLLGVMVSANEIRRDDGPIQKAEKCRRLLQAGYTEDELANVFGVTRPTINNWLSILDAPAPVRKAIDRGEIAPTVAAKIKNLTREEQVEAIEKAKKTSKKGRATVKGARANAGPMASRMRNRKEIEAKLEATPSNSDYADALKWVLRLDDE